jgi:hypothetical protein
MLHSVGDSEICSLNLRFHTRSNSHAYLLKVKGLMNGFSMEQVARSLMSSEMPKETARSDTPRMAFNLLKLCKFSIDYSYTIYS